MPADDETAPGTARVLFLFDHLGYPNGASHGLTRYCLDVLPRVNTGAVDVTACFLREAHPAAARLIEAGVRTVFLGRSKWDPFAVLDVVELIRTRGIDIVHAAGHKGILVGRAAAWMTGCRTIIHLHDLYGPSPPIRQMLRASASWTDVALGVSRAVCTFAESEYRIPTHRVELLYNGIDIAAFAGAEPARVLQWRDRFALGGASHRIGIIGRLSAGKGHERLIRQMPRVLERVPGAVLVVVGGGPLRDSLEDLVARLGLRAAVRFVGHQEDVRTVLAALELVVIPSDHEGVSFVALEAMAARRPIVASRGGGLPEIVVHGESGVLVSVQEEDTLGDAIVDLLRDPVRATRLAEAGQRYVERFAIHHHVSQLRSLYARAGRDVPVRRTWRQPVSASAGSSG